MSTQQLVLSLVLATMVFSVALELKVDDFRRVAQAPRAVLCGLVPQFLLLPGATWLATLVLDLPPSTEAAMSERAECVMLNKGAYIVEAVGILDDVLTRMQAHQVKKTPQLRALHSW